MDKQAQAVQRGEEADRLLNSEMFQRAFTDTRRAILDTWATLPTSEKENAYDLHRMVKCLDRVRHCLEKHIETGKLAKHEIEGRGRLLDRFRG